MVQYTALQKDDKNIIVWNKIAFYLFSSVTYSIIEQPVHTVQCNKMQWYAIKYNDTTGNAIDYNKLQLNKCNTNLMTNEFRLVPMKHTVHTKI